MLPIWLVLGYLLWDISPQEVRVGRVILYILSVLIVLVWNFFGWPESRKANEFHLGPDVNITNNPPTFKPAK